MGKRLEEEVFNKFSAVQTQAMLFLRMAEELGEEIITHLFPYTKGKFEKLINSEGKIPVTPSTLSKYTVELCKIIEEVEEKFYEGKTLHNLEDVTLEEIKEVNQEKS